MTKQWENCREQGYVIMFRCKDKQLNIAFFEHRNTDWLHAVKWEQITDNTPSINNFPKDHPYYQDKYATSFAVEYGEVLKMANWIEEQLTDFWVKCNLEKKHN